MAAEPLVEQDIRTGETIIAALDSAGFVVAAAFWLYYEDVGTWKLWIATPEAEKDLQAAYMKVGAVLTGSEEPLQSFDLSRINIVQPGAAMVKALRGFLNVKGTSRVRFSRNLLDGIYIDDALIYRTAA